MNDDIPIEIAYLSALAPLLLFMVAAGSLVIAWIQTKGTLGSVRLQTIQMLMAKWSDPAFQQRVTAFFDAAKAANQRSHGHTDMAIFNIKRSVETDHSDEALVRKGAHELAGFCQLAGFSIARGYATEGDVQELFGETFKQYARWAHNVVHNPRHFYPYAEKYARKWYRQEYSAHQVNEP